ncbi:MAG: zinc transporter ZntB [Planctomycetes bacterium]|nr:zinc transporter ZntB [Planctomycetota bacterium]
MALAWNEIASSQKPIWIHLDRTSPAAQEWIKGASGLDPHTCEALLQEETRPRVVVGDAGILLILRGVNLNPGSDPEDMISIRCWVEPRRVITLRREKVMAIQDLRDRLTVGKGPIGPADFVVALAGGLVARMSAVVTDIEEVVDDFETRVLENAEKGLRYKLSETRRTTIMLRRYLAPQKDALGQLFGSVCPWLTAVDRSHLREVLDRTARCVEDLDAARERTQIIHEELAARMAEQMNRTMYLVSIVTSVFLPLGLITGLLGINVGGIPGTESHYAFAAVCGLMAVIIVVQVFLFRRMKWL